MPTPTDRQQLIATFRRRDAWRSGLGRVATALLLAAAVAASLVWAIAQPWWSPALLARLPQPAAIAQWLRSPDLTALPGLPPEWNPWAPLTLEQPNTLLTPWKINRLESDPAACKAWLSVMPGSDLSPQPDFADSSTLLCGWKTASRISQLDGVRFSSPFTLACGAAVSLARWEHHALQPAAMEHLGSKVVRIEHLGSYACRTIGSGAEGPLSTHATANALDIAGFTLADGRRVDVRKDWRSAQAASTSTSTSTSTSPTPTAGDEARFLRAARDGACRSFHAVLGPDYNDAHRDHFHLDRGPYRICR